LISSLAIQNKQLITLVQMFFDEERERKKNVNKDLEKE
jgi:hypothetical protein